MALQLDAVVVTHNRPDFLARCLQSIAAQTLPVRRTYLVDNSDSADTNAVVIREHKNLVYVRPGANLGGAGGFHLGLRRAVEEGADGVWLLDDDCEPAPTALQILAEVWDAQKDKTRVGFVCSHVEWTDGSACLMNIPAPTWDFLRDYSLASPVIRVASCSFVSALVPSSVVRDVGLPIRDFFIWCDDLEFTDRITRAGYTGLSALASRVTHRMAENEGVSFERLSDANAWKYAYGARNAVAMYSHRSLRSGMGHARRILKDAMHASAGPATKARIARAAVTGLFWRYAIERVDGVKE